MTRLSRISPAGVPVHIIQRGNNRQVCFVSDEDHGAYVNWLKEYSLKYRVDIQEVKRGQSKIKSYHKI